MSHPSLRAHANELILFAAILGTYPTVALRRAAQLARERGAALHVLLATERAAHTLNIDEAIDAVGNTATAQSAALAWCRSALGCDPALLLHTGDELEQAVRDYTTSYRPVLVVLAPDDRHAAWIRAFVTRTRVAVLVARERVAAGLALVATDLQDPSHAVLWRADELLSPSSAAVAIHVRRRVCSSRAPPRCLASNIQHEAQLSGDPHPSALWIPRASASSTNSGARRGRVAPHHCAGAWHWPAA